MFNFIKKYNRFENFSIFIISVLLYLLNRFILLNINNFTVHYFFSSYFDDLLAPLLLFSYINLLLSIYNKKLYSLKYLIISMLLVSFVWEYLIVFIKHTSVSDPIDVIFYVLGTVIYWIIHNKWNQKTNKIMV
jgi:hypothetical protein